MSTLIIGLGYKARRGKDTVARAIIEGRGKQYDIRRYAFADALKQDVNAEIETCGSVDQLFQYYRLMGAPLPNGDRLLLPDWVQQEDNPDMTDPMCPYGKQRTLLQWWGTEYRRERCDKFYWVRRMQKALERDKPQVAVITDLRFTNELLWVKAQGGFTVHVDRVGFVDASTNPTHGSESELDRATWDFTISVPDGEPDMLRQDAVTLFDMIVQTLDVVKGWEDVAEKAGSVRPEHADGAPERSGAVVPTVVRVEAPEASVHQRAEEPVQRPADCNRRRVTLELSETGKFSGGNFGQLMRQYAYDRMGRDREYRKQVLARKKAAQ